MSRPNREDYTKTYGTTLGEVYESTNLCEYTPALEKYCDELEKQVEDYSTKAGTYKFKVENLERANLEKIKALDKASHLMFLEEKKVYDLKQALDKACKELADAEKYMTGMSKEEWKEWCLKDE